jgi:hypothetical protein
MTILTFLADKFKSEYLYNIRHAYGDVGGDANRRGQGYTPYSCQKLLSEALPAAGQNHGCPYRTYNPDNLITLLQSVGVSDKDLLRTVREDVGKQRYHIACNRVFESAHKSELKKVCSDCDGFWPHQPLMTSVHRSRTNPCGRRANWTQFCIRTITSNAVSCSETLIRSKTATSESLVRPADRVSESTRCWMSHRLCDGRGDGATFYMTNDERQYMSQYDITGWLCSQRHGNIAIFALGSDDHVSASDTILEMLVCPRTPS